jgi:hypothetical protein
MNRYGLFAAIVAIIIAESANVQATSCKSMSDNYVLSCDSSHCRPLFRAVETPAYGECGRALQIAPFPAWALEPIVAAVRASTLRSKSSLVTAVGLRHRYPDVAGSENDLRETLRWEEPKVSQHVERPEVVRGWYAGQCAADARTVHTRIVQHVFIAGAVLSCLFGTLIWLAVALARRPSSVSGAILRRALAVRGAFLLVGVGMILLIPVVPTPFLLVGPLAILFAFLDVAVYLAIRWQRV